MIESAGWFARLLVSSAAVGVVPGAAVLLAWRPRPVFGLIEFLGFSFAASFGIAHLLTLLAIVFHWAPAISLALMAAITAGHLVAWLCRAPRASIQVTRTELVLALLVSVPAVCLYGLGSPFEEGDDRIHVALVQRLAHLGAPATDKHLLLTGHRTMTDILGREPETYRRQFDDGRWAVYEVLR